MSLGSNDEQSYSDTEAEFVIPTKDAKCMASGSFSVVGCEDCMDGFFPCPCRADPDYRSFLQFKYEYDKNFRRTKARLAIVAADVLRTHRVPLHWEVLCQIIQGRFPEKRYKNVLIYQALRDNMHLFVTVSPGVYALSEWGHR